MINVAILYPNVPGARFDVGYYLDRHMPMAIELMSTHPGYRGVSVEVGLGGSAPGTDAAFVAMCNYRFNSAEDFRSAFGPHAEWLQGDMAKYTDIEPTIQLNEIVIAR
jgi:uncharacterized protein (TIGR02118 family)